MKNNCNTCQEPSPNHSCACSLIDSCPCMNCLIKSMCSKTCPDFWGHSDNCRTMIGDDEFWGMGMPHNKIQ